MDLFVAAGIIAAMAQVSAYFLIQLNIVKATHSITLCLNLGGSILFLISLSQDFNIGAFIIQGCWFFIGMVALIKKIRKACAVKTVVT